MSAALVLPVNASAAVVQAATLGNAIAAELSNGIGHTYVWANLPHDLVARFQAAMLGNPGPGGGGPESLGQLLKLVKTAAPHPHRFDTVGFLLTAAIAAGALP